MNAVLGLLALSMAVTVPARANLLADQTIEVTYLFPNTSAIFAAAADIVGPAGCFPIALVSRFGYQHPDDYHQGRGHQTRHA